MCMSALPAGMFVPNGRIRSSRTGVADGCKPPYECWELKPGPLQEQYMLITMEPSLPPYKLTLI